jgi:hypothetical protein
MRYWRNGGIIGAATMSDFPDFEAISQSFQAFKNNPTPLNRSAIRGQISPFQEENQSVYAEAAGHALAGLDNAYLSVGQIHAILVEASNMAGVDPATLGGGNTQ